MAGGMFSTMFTQLLLAVWLLWQPNNSLATLRLLGCHSVNSLPQQQVSDFLFISSKKEDCVFILEGPEGSRLDIEIRNIPIPKQSQDNILCNKSGISVYSYINERLVRGKLSCQIDGSHNVMAKSNTALVTSGASEGSFSMRVRPTVDRSEQRSSDFREIEGMSPPLNEAREFYSFETGYNSFDDDFRPIVLLKNDNFRPSRPELPSSYYRPHYYYWPYPGQPTGHFDLTYNSTGVNFTLESTSPSATTTTATVSSSIVFSSPSDELISTSTPKASDFPNSSSLGTTVSPASTTEPFDEEQ